MTRYEVHDVIEAVISTTDFPVGPPFPFRTLKVFVRTGAGTHEIVLFTSNMELVFKKGESDV